MGCFMHAISLSYQSEPLIMTVSPACIQPTTLWLKQSTFVFAEYSYDKLLSNYCVLLIVSQFVLPSATEDYAITSSNLTFSATMPSQMVTIPIREDTIVEDSETIIVTLTPSDPAAILNPPSATVTIEDNDGKYSFAC